MLNHHIAALIRHIARNNKETPAVILFGQDRNKVGDSGYVLVRGFFHVPPRDHRDREM